MFNRVLFHPFTIILVTIITGLGIFSLRQTIGEFKQSAQQLQKSEQEVAQLRLKAEEAKQKLEVASSDFTKEKIARDELLVQRENEQVLQVILPSGAPEASTKQTKKTSLEEWLELIF